MSGRLIAKLLREPEPTGPTRLVLLVIASHARDDGTGAEVSMATIAREAGLETERAAQKHVKRLRDAGYLTDVRRPRRVNAWTVHLNPVRTDAHQPRPNGRPSAAVNPVRTDAPTPSGRTPTTPSGRTPTRGTGSKERAYERLDISSLGGFLPREAPATNGSNPPTDEGPDVPFTEAGAAEWLTWLWAKPPSDGQMEMIREVVGRADANGRAPGWRWVIERVFRTFRRLDESTRRSYGNDPLTYLLELDKRWQKQEAYP